VSPAISADLLVQSIFHDHNVNLQQAHAAPACNVHIDRLDRHPDRTRLHPPVPPRHLLQAGHQLHRHPSGSHIQLAEVELYDPSGAKMPTSSLQLAMSSTYNWNNNPNNPRPAALCNDGSYTTLCHSENPSSGDPWPWLAATYPCPEGSTSLSKVVVVNRHDCQACWFTIDAYSLVFYNAAGEQDVPPIRISSVGSTLRSYSINMPAPIKRPPPAPALPPPNCSTTEL
jgi:hypothetical protein